jgi:tetratricopeptide (TPR) repeat protein
MNLPEKDLHDIYQTDEPLQERVPEISLPELIQRSLRRQRIITGASVGVAFLLASGLTVAVVKEYLSAARPVPVTQKTPYFEAYSLPEEEQWALEYRQIAFQADRGEPPGAKPLSTKWVKNAAYHTIMGEQALRLNQLSAARHHLEKARETFPDLSGIQRTLGVVYLKQLDFEPAAKQLREALREEESVDVLANLGAALIGLKEYAPAEAFLKAALERQPELAGCYKNLALLYQQTGRGTEAAEAFETYLARNPLDTKMLEHYVAWLISEKKTGEVAAFLGRLEGTDPAASYLLLAGVLAQDGDAEGSVRALQKAALFLTPRQTIVEMRGDVFRTIARSGPFEDFLHRMELAAVSLSPAVEAGGNGLQKKER